MIYTFPLLYRRIIVYI